MNAIDRRLAHFGSWRGQRCSELKRNLLAVLGQLLCLFAPVLDINRCADVEIADVLLDLVRVAPQQIAVAHDASLIQDSLQFWPDATYLCQVVWRNRQDRGGTG